MTKICPYTPTSSSSHCSSSTDREMFTIWMKSLVINGNGYTVYNSNGEVVYRIDNYDTKCCDEVYLMDLQGNVLSTIIRKKLLSSGLWDGYKSNGPKRNEKPWFKVRKDHIKFLKRHSNSSYIVTMGCDGDEQQRACFYKIEGLSTSKSDFNIRDSEGRIVAAVKQKVSNCGVFLKDVLSLEMEPLMDHSLIMAIIAVYGLISRKM